MMCTLLLLGPTTGVGATGVGVVAATAAAVVGAATVAASAADEAETIEPAITGAADANGLLVTAVA